MANEEQSEELKALWDELQEKAYNTESHNYHFKESNQVIRVHFEKMIKEKDELLKTITKAFEAGDLMATDAILAKEIKKRR